MSGGGEHRSLAPWRRAARALRLALRDPVGFRSRLFYRHRNPELFQPQNSTGEDRHPTVFRALRDLIGQDGEGSLLSFGCSTGEEVFTLRRYFPRATLKGIDINPHNIAVAEARLARAPDAGMAFAAAGSARDEASQAYDAILCLSVLRHTALEDPRVTDSARFLRFADFARTATDLARCVKPGGLLVIRHSNFRFGDVPAAAQFESIVVPELAQTAVQTAIFGPDNRRLQGAVYDDVIFRKTRQG